MQAVDLETFKQEIVKHSKKAEERRPRPAGPPFVSSTSSAKFRSWRTSTKHSKTKGVLTPFPCRKERPTPFARTSKQTCWTVTV